MNPLTTVAPSRWAARKVAAISSAARHILIGEGELYIAGGTESMSTFPYAIRGPRSAKSLRSLQTLKENWAHVWEDPEVALTETALRLRDLQRAGWTTHW